MIELPEDLVDQIFDVSVKRTGDDPSSSVVKGFQRHFQANFGGICAEVATRLSLEIDPLPALEHHYGGDVGYDLEVNGQKLSIKGRHQDTWGQDMLIPVDQHPFDLDYYVQWRNDTPYHVRFLGWADKETMVKYAYWNKQMPTPCWFIRRHNLLSNLEEFKRLGVDIT
jgi:hypothetical protein